MDQLSDSPKDGQVSTFNSDNDTSLTTPRRLSVPMTKYTVNKAVNLPKKALVYIKEVVGELFPELQVSLLVYSSMSVLTKPRVLV